MVTPNNAPHANSGSKALAALLWRSRRHTSESVEKSKKDWWDKADILAKWLIAFVTAIGAGIISIVVAIIGGNIQQAVTSQTGKIQESIAVQNTGKDYVQIALNILEKKDLTDEMQKNKGLREWAVGLLNYYSPVKLTTFTSEQLINGEAKIPVISLKDIEQIESLIYKGDSPFVTQPVAVSRNMDVEAAVTAQGLVVIKSRLSIFPPLRISTSIKSPKGIIYSPNESHLVAFNDHSFALLIGIQNDLLGPSYVLSKQVSPPYGISKLAFSDDSKMIILTGTDDKQIRYDLDGKEIK